MRSRQTDIAVSTCSGASSASELTGSGAFTTTSCAPRAGRLANRSGSPRPPASGSAPASPAPSSEDSAGYRFGTTRTRQLAVLAERVHLRRRAVLVPGRERVALGVDRRARRDVEEGAGPRAALPGDDHAQAGQRVDAQLRQAASPSPRARCPPRRRSGRARCTRPPRRAAARRSARAGRSTSAPAPTRHPVGLAQDRRGDAVAAAVALDGQPPEPRDLAAEEQPAGADHGAVVDGDDVGGLGVAAVLVGLERHALLVAEHPRAQRERRAHLVLGECLADLHGQRA